jgi:uncharacterized membrane protein YsdA (DUF1294 family)
VIASVACFIAYVVDKRAARLKRRRIAERTLLLLGLVGGWPGGLVAQHVVRHKTAKGSFQARFWATVGGNAALLYWLVA